MKILIAEDDRDLQETMGMLMDIWGFDFDIAPNGRSAVELAETNDGEYDLCLMDIDMPIMDGFEVTETIRKKTSYFPVMALTGNLITSDEYSKSGMDDYLQKPYNAETLYDKINTLTTKSIKIDQTQDEITLTEEKPMNPDELKELLELKKKGLTKLRVVGVGETFVVHRNIQNKISYDLVGEGKELSEFIDRSEEEPGRCHLYKMNLHVTKDLFTPDELQEAIQREDQIAIRFEKATDKKLPG